jgi:hypothetical protein
VYVDPFPPTGSRTRLSAEEGSSPQWSANGREIFYGTSNGQVMRVALTFSGGSIRAGVPRSWTSAPALFAHNGFVLDRATERVLALSGNTALEPLTVTLNWPALMEKP